MLQLKGSQGRLPARWQGIQPREEGLRSVSMCMGGKMSKGQISFFVQCKLITFEQFSALKAAILFWIIMNLRLNGRESYSKHHSKYIYIDENGWFLNYKVISKKCNILKVLRPCCCHDNRPTYPTMQCIRECTSGYTD